VAEPALARAHRHGRVALGELDRVEALRDRTLQVLVRHVFADADEALALLRGAVVGRRGHGAGQAFAGNRSHRLDPGWNVGRDEDSLIGVVLDPCARLREQGVGRLAATRHDEEVTVDLAPVDLDAAQDPPTAAPDDLGQALAPQVVDGPDLDTRLAKEACRVAARLVGGHDHGPFARLDAPVLDEPTNAVREHDADEVVPGKDEWLLDRPGRDDDVLGAEAVEHAACVDGNEAAFPDPESPPGGDHLDAVEVDEALVHEHDVAAGPRMLGCRLTPGSPASDHQDLGSTVLDVVAVGPCRVLVELAETGDVAEELLVQRPGPARPDHRPVVEADWREGPAHLVGHRQEVVLQ